MTFPTPVEVNEYPTWVCKIWAFLWLIRLVPSAAATLAVFAGIRLTAGVTQPKVLTIAMTSTFLVTSGCSAWNDYCDWEVDTINLPYRPIPSGILSRKLAVIYAIFAFSGAVVISVQLGIAAVGFYALAAGAALVYSPLIKKRSSAKNLYVAAYSASLLLFGGYIGGNVFPTFIPAAIIITSVIARELLMDIHDFAGDSTYGYRTLPIVIGLGVSRRIVAVLLAFTACLQSFLLNGRMEESSAVILIVSILCFSWVLMLIIVKKEPSRDDFLYMIRLLMLGMLLGIVSLGL